MSWVTTLWNKTIFSDWINNYKQKKRMEREAKEEALQQIKPFIKEELVLKYAQQELDKYSNTKKSGGMLDKLAKEFGTSKIGNKDKLQELMGGRTINTEKHTKDKGNDQIDKALKKMLGK